MPVRNPFEERTVVSRRGRPAKEPLSRQRIVSTAVDLLAKEGLEGLSLRRVAKVLDTGAASLYVYVANLRELQALVLDHVLAEVEIPRSRRGSWRVRVRSLLESYFRVLVSHPGLAHLALTTVASGPNYLRIVETLLALLDEGGVPPIAASWGLDLLTLQMTALAAEQSDPQVAFDRLDPIQDALGNLKAAQYPRVYEARQSLLGGGSGARFAWGVDVLLNGILASPAPRSRPAG